MVPSLRLALLAVVALAAASAGPGAQDGAPDRPNLLWLTAEDHGPDLGCYGVEVARTPQLDALAERGVRFARCWSNAPVCAPARTAILLGVHPPAIGALNMRSAVPLPAGLRPFPALLREAGYHTSNNRKTDYNLQLGDERPWDASSGRAHWRQRDGGQPFFAVFNFTESHESRIRRRPHEAVLDPDAVTVPPLHPDTPQVRRDRAQYHDRIAVVDARAGELLDQLRADGLDDDTVVMFYADHGSGLPGYKRAACNRGLHVPLIVYVPPRWREWVGLDVDAGGVCDELVSFVDLAPTALSLCGIEPPAWMHGRAVLGPHREPAPELLWGYRGRMDERHDCVRTVTDGRFVYVRNFVPRLPDGQHVAYQFETPTTRVWFGMFAAGVAPPVQAAFWTAPRPAEQLFDLQSDPHEVVDLAAAPGHAATLRRLRRACLDVSRRHGDRGLVPESLRAEPLPSAARSTAELVACVDLCSRLPAAERGALAGHLDDEDPRLRWWALQGLAGAAPAVRAELRPQLVARLDDDAAAVRVLAAELVASDDDARERAVEVLLTAADPAHAGHFVALDAWNALDRLGTLLAPWRARIDAIPLREEERPPRFGGYLQRVRAHLLATLDR